jgi:heme ABC exporter ATP-binding subunit CcmA
MNKVSAAGSGTPTLAIDASDVARRFGTSWVLRGVTLRASAGEVVGLLGANGSGKSTLLKIFSTLLKPQAGVVRVWGHDVVRSPQDVRSLIGYLAHSPGLYDDLTARENLAFVASMLDRNERDADVALERVGLNGVAGKQVRGLSAGMQRRLAIARLMLVQPRLLLLDEPYSNLDADGIELMNSLILEWTNAGAAALVVVHELAPAAAVLHRTVTIRGGRIEPKAKMLSDADTGVPMAANR